MEINGEADHIHVVLLFLTSFIIVSIVNTLKIVALSHNGYPSKAR